MQGKWERKTGKYSSGDYYRVGKVIVGSAGPNETRSKNDPMTFVCHCDLPGIKQSDTKYETIDLAKLRLQNMVLTWFKWCNEEPNA